MHRGLRILGYFAGGLVVLVLLLIGGVYGFSSRDFNALYDVSVAPLVVSPELSEEALLERGAHLSHIRGCADCHAADGGGKEFADDPAFGVLWATNLTSGEGGVAASYSDEDWDRAIRHGVRPDGKSLMFMPSYEFWPLSDDDIAALMAHYRNAPPVDRTRPATRPGPLARVLYLAGQLPLVPAKLVDHDAVRPAAPAEGPTSAYGSYLATGCIGCHGKGFSGGKIAGGDPSWPPAANITPDRETGIGNWTMTDFATALRQGVRPDGSTVDPAMPIEATKHLTDLEMEALYNYLMTVEPKPFGNR